MEIIPSTPEGAVLSLLIDLGENAGRQLRRMLAADGQDLSGPQFYSLMAELEHAGYVEGWYAEATIGGQQVSERRFRATVKASAAVDW